MDLTEFRTTLDDMRNQAHQFRYVLEEELVNNCFDRGSREPLTLLARVKDITDDEGQQDSLLDACYWCREYGDIVLIHQDSVVYRRKSDVVDCITSIWNGTPQVVSPREIVENT